MDFVPRKIFWNFWKVAKSKCFFITWHYRLSIKLTYFPQMLQDPQKKYKCRKNCSHKKNYLPGMAWNRFCATKNILSFLKIVLLYNMPLQIVYKVDIFSTNVAHLGLLKNSKIFFLAQNPLQTILGRFFFFSVKFVPTLVIFVNFWPFWSKFSSSMF